MKQSGFSLLELLTVIAIIGVLVAIASLGFKSMTEKSRIERQVKEMYADLVTARAQALYRKVPRSLAVSGGGFSVYSSADGTGTPLAQKALSYPIVSSSTDTVCFDARGTALSAASGMILATPKLICVEPSGSGASVDSIIISATTVQMGKRKKGEACDNITKIDVQ